MNNFIEHLRPPKNIPYSANFLGAYRFSLTI